MNITAHPFSALHVSSHGSSSAMATSHPAWVKDAQAIAQSVAEHPLMSPLVSPLRAAVDFFAPPRAGDFCAPPRAGDVCAPPRAGSFCAPPRAVNFCAPPRAGDFCAPPRAVVAKRLTPFGVQGQSATSIDTPLPPISNDAQIRVPQTLEQTPNRATALAPAVRVVRVIDPKAPLGAAGRMRISGRIDHVCAELDRLAALEARAA